MKKVPKYLEVGEPEENPDVWAVRTACVMGAKDDDSQTELRPGTPRPSQVGNQETVPLLSRVLQCSHPTEVDGKSDTHAYLESRGTYLAITGRTRQTSTAVGRRLQGQASAAA